MAQQKSSAAFLFGIFGLALTLTGAGRAQPAKSAPTSGGAGSDYLFRLEGGYGFYSGIAGNSFSGARFYSALIGLEDASGFLRPLTSLQLDYLPRTALALGQTETDFSFTGLKLAGGFAVYPLVGSGVQPFIAGTGSFTRGSADPHPQTPELPTYFRPNLWGYEVSVGVDFRGNRSGKSSARLRMSYSVEQGNFGELASFKSSAMRFGAGVGF